ncbi:MAG: hypothetical protein M3Z08_11890 [Chloroflexota bacterium]|nr:hypothetical protein [Chloroflexota bacterium]
MNDHKQFEVPPGSAELALWLQRVMPPPGTDGELASVNSEQLALLQDDQDHLRFYQQLPNFVLALLNGSTQLDTRYASLLYHLLGCPTCHNAYLEIYRAMRVTVQSGMEPLEMSQPALPLATVPPRVLVHLCQSLIRQAELVLRAFERDESERQASARALLRRAMQVSAHMMQMRGRALQDLVRVATLFEQPAEESGQQLAAYTYSWQLTGSGARHGGKVLRRAEAPTRSPETPAGQPAIYIQSHSLEGSITQQGNTLELHLQDLDASLHGAYVSVSVPLGGLLEPVRWLGGNPRAIRSSAPVDDHGSLSTPLGETALRLTNTEERNLLEVMFLRLEVRPVK